jgi:hypothetical protein
LSPEQDEVLPEVTSVVPLVAIGPPGYEVSETGEPVKSPKTWAWLETHLANTRQNNRYIGANRMQHAVTNLIHKTIMDLADPLCPEFALLQNLYMKVARLNTGDVAEKSL